MRNTFLEEMADYMVTQSLATATGTDLFWSHMPDVSEDPAVCLYNDGGAGKRHNPSKGRAVRVFVRSSDYQTARQKAKDIHAAFHRKTGLSLDTLTVLYALGTSLPRSLGRDNRNRAVMSFALTVDTVVTPIVVEEDVVFSNVSFAPITRTQITGNVDTNPEAGTVIMHYKLQANPGDEWTEVALTGTNPHTGTATALSNGTQYRIGFSHDGTWSSTFYLVTTGTAGGGGGQWEQE